MLDLKNLIKSIIVVNPEHRTTMLGIRTHPWISAGYNDIPATDMPQRTYPISDEDNAVLEKIVSYGFDADYIRQQLRRSQPNHVSAMYHLVREREQRRREHPLLFDRSALSRLPLPAIKLQQSAPVRISLISPDSNIPHVDRSELYDGAFQIDIAIPVFPSKSRKSNLADLSPSDRYGFLKRRAEVFRSELEQLTAKLHIKQDSNVLFSVSTNTTLPVAEVCTEIERALATHRVGYSNSGTRFFCRHLPTGVDFEVDYGSMRGEYRRVHIRRVAGDSREYSYFVQRLMTDLQLS